MTVREICHLLYFDPDNLEGASRALRIPALSPGWRQSFEERLAKAGASIAFDEGPEKSRRVVDHKGNPTMRRGSR